MHASLPTPTRAGRLAGSGPSLSSGSISPNPLSRPADNNSLWGFPKPGIHTSAKARSRYAQQRPAQRYQEVFSSDRQRHVKHDAYKRFADPNIGKAAAVITSRNDDGPINRWKLMSACTGGEQQLTTVPTRGRLVGFVYRSQNNTRRGNERRCSDVAGLTHRQFHEIAMRTKNGLV